MKIIALILSIYILALNFTPCEDSKTFDDNKTELSQKNNANHNHNETDLCSPFCHCQCCQVHTADIGISTNEPLPVSISSKIYFYIDNLGKDISSPILQPPRV